MRQWLPLRWLVACLESGHEANGTGSGERARVATTTSDYDEAGRPMNFPPEEDSDPGRLLRLHPIPGHGWVDASYQQLLVPPDFALRVVVSIRGGPGRPALLGVVKASPSVFSGLWCALALRGDRNDLGVGAQCNVVLFKERPPTLNWLQHGSPPPMFVAAGFAVVRAGPVLRRQNSSGETPT